MEELRGKTAFVTGAASGIGLALAGALLDEGMNVAMADIDGAGVEAARQGLGADDSRAFGLRLDVADPSAWPKAVDDAERRLGPVSLLCNNAGISGGMLPLLDMPTEIWQQTIAINLGGVFNGFRTVVPRIVARGTEGHLVNTASILGLIATEGFGAYCASKSGVVALSEVLRFELAPKNIGVSVLCPGAVATNIAANTRRIRREALPEVAAKLAPATPRVDSSAPRMKPESVARQVVSAIKANALYVIPHPDYAPLLEARVRKLHAAFGESAEPGFVEPADTLAAMGRGPYA